MFLEHRTYSAEVEVAVGIKVGLHIVNSEVLQRAVTGGTAETDDLLQGVVGLACDGQHEIARAEQAEQSDRQCLRAADDLLAQFMALEKSLAAKIAQL